MQLHNYPFLLEPSGQLKQETPLSQVLQYMGQDLHTLDTSSKNPAIHPQVSPTLLDPGTQLKHLSPSLQVAHENLHETHVLLNSKNLSTHLHCLPALF